MQRVRKINKLLLKHLLAGRTRKIFLLYDEGQLKLKELSCPEWENGAPKSFQGVRGPEVSLQVGEQGGLWSLRQLRMGGKVSRCCFSLFPTEIRLWMFILT